MSHKIFRLATSLFVALAITIIATGTQPTRAAGPWYVTLTGNDTNDCLSPNTPCGTINGAIGKATDGDIINVAMGTYTGSDTYLVTIEKSLNLSGGWDATFTSNTGVSTIDGQNTNGGVSIYSASNPSSLTVTLEHFTIQNTVTGMILGYNPAVTLNNITINGNGVNNAAYGGGIYMTSGRVTINNSTITGNEAGTSGGGIYLATNGVYPVVLTIQNSTIAHNNANSGGGIGNDGGIVFLHNSILANNTSITSPDCSGTIGTSDHNIIGNISGCTVAAGTGDQFNIDPQLNTFLPVEGYYPLLPSSPAIDAGNPATCLATDQRGTTRPQGIGCDIGSYEYVFTTPGPATSLAVLSGSGQQLSQLNIAFPKPLRVVALDDQGNRVSGVTVTFTAPESGASGTFADTGTNITTVDTDAGGVATTSIFTANDQAGAYTVAASATGVGSVNFNLEQVSPPTNDNFANAEVIALLPFSDSLDNTLTTIEPGEPHFCGSTPETKSVWYSFTPVTDVVMSADMFGSSFSDANLTVFQQVGPGFDGLNFLNRACFGGSLIFSAQAGITYYFQAESLSSGGDLHVNLQEVPAPANDNFADAEIITSLPFSTTVDNTGTTTEPDEPITCGSTRSLWYSFTPTQDMAVRVDMVGATSGGVSIYLSSGPAISDLTFLGCAFQNNAVNLNLETGKTYYLQVSDFGQPGVLEFNLQEIFPPGNDNFTNVEAITSLPFSTSLDNTDATTEAGEPFGCGFSGRSVWYTFTPTQNIAVRVDMAGSPTPGAVTVYHSSGPAISDLTILGCASQNNAVNLNLEASKTYYLQVSDFGQPGVLEFNLQEIFPPANDSFANAQVITSLPFSAIVDNTDATTEVGEPFSCGTFLRTVWYAFTPTQDMAVRLDMTGSPTPGSVTVYLSSGPGISDLTFLTCAFENNSANFNVEAGMTYYLQVTPSGSQFGLLQFNLQQIFPPANDNFANAEVITSLPFSTTVDNTDATTEPNEPFGCGTFLRTVWYAFTPTQDLTVRLDMAGSSTLGAVSVYLSSGPGISDLTFLTCAFENEAVNFDVEAGKTYYLQVTPSGSQTGLLQFNLQQIFPPANDDFANAEVITSLPFSVSVDNTDATTEVDEPFGCGTFLRTVWYAFTPTQDMALRLDMAGSPTPGAVSLYLASGPGISDLTFLTCAFENSSNDFNVEAGMTYYLQVTPSGSQTGVLQFHLENLSPSASEVTIDIKPGNEHNRIMIASGDSASVQVAILSTADFDAPAQVDKNSLTFGATGDENSLRRRFLIGTPDCRARDVNRDRIKDLVCSFLIGQTGFKLGDTVGILKGQTVDGTLLEGRDSVVITAPSYPSYPSYP